MTEQEKPTGFFQFKRSMVPADLGRQHSLCLYATGISIISRYLGYADLSLLMPLHDSVRNAFPSVGNGVERYWGTLKEGLDQHNGRAVGPRIQKYMVCYVKHNRVS